MPRAEAKYWILAQDKTKGAIDSATRGLDRLKGAAGGAAAGVAVPLAALAGALGALVALINNVSARLADLGRMGRDVAATGREAAVLGFVGARRGLSPEQLIGGLEQLSEKIIAATQEGDPEARRQFAALGLRAQELERMDRVEQLIALDQARERLPKDLRTGAISDLIGGGFGRLFEGGQTVQEMVALADTLKVTEEAMRRQTAALAFEESKQSIDAAIDARLDKAVTPMMEKLAPTLEQAAKEIATGEPGAAAAEAARVAGAAGMAFGAPAPTAASAILRIMTQQLRTQIQTRDRITTMRPPGVYAGEN